MINITEKTVTTRTVEIQGRSFNLDAAEEGCKKRGELLNVNTMNQIDWCNPEAANALYNELFAASIKPAVAVAIVECVETQSFIPA